MYSDAQREFLNQYSDIDWSDKDIYWELPVEIIKMPIPKNGFNVKDLAYALVDEIEDRLEFQSKYDNPDELTNL